MDVEIVTDQGAFETVKWNVGIPGVGSSVESKFFLVCGYKWNLKLAAKFSDYTALLWMTLYYSDNKNPPRFPLIVFIGKKEGYLFQKATMISKQSSEIWCATYRELRKKHPEIEDFGNRVQFVLEFHLGIPDLETPIEVEKSVQTSDPDHHLCLENLSLDLSKLVEGDTDTDVQLKCGEVSIGAHKVILRARSEVFRAMMQSDMVEGREGIVEITDMEPNNLKIFIRYIYTGTLPELTVDSTLPIYEAADKYQVEALKKRSSQLLVKNLSPDNALRILPIADAHSDSELKDQVVSYIIEEKMPSRKVEWLKFCNQYPKLANDVFNVLYDLISVSQ